MASKKTSLLQTYQMKKNHDISSEVVEESQGKLLDLLFDLGITTAELVSGIPALTTYATGAKVAIYGIKATRLYKQAINIFTDEDKLLKNKKIKREDIESNFNQDMLDNLFGLERDQTIEEIKFNFLKKVILVGLTKDEKGRIQAKHFFKTISELSTTELLILGSCYYYSTVDRKWKGDPGNAGNPHNWRQTLAVHTGVGIREIIEETEQNLTNRKLIYPDRGGANLYLGENFRLTDFGYGLCKFVSEYDKLFE